MKENLQKLIIQNFDEASYQYNQGAYLQMIFAKKLAEQCRKQLIQPGLWFDLGSGTGLLANELERLHPHQSVIRVDASQNMLRRHRHKKLTQLTDLNLGLPKFDKAPTLIASNFALHWLSRPEQKLKEWFSALAPGGWLAIALPVQGSFPEWHNAAKQAQVGCTAIHFPSQSSLLNAINHESIHFQELEHYREEAKTITSLLKPIVDVGAHTSPAPSLTIGEWRKLQKAWRKSSQDLSLSLTWLIQILLAQK